MWQKARAKVGPHEVLLDRYGFNQAVFNGVEVWVIGPAFEDIGDYEADGPFMFCNLLFPYPEDNELRVISLSRFELMPEFADDVPLIPWDEFVRGRQ